MIFHHLRIVADRAHSTDVLLGISSIRANYIFLSWGTRRHIRARTHAHERTHTHARTNTRTRAGFPRDLLRKKKNLFKFSCTRKIVLFDNRQSSLMHKISNGVENIMLPRVKQKKKQRKKERKEKNDALSLGLRCYDAP